MNEDWMTELEPRAGDELERHLDRFARLRLEPSHGQVKRARSAVMEAAWRQKIEGRATAQATHPDVLEPSVTAASMTVLPPRAPRTESGRHGLFEAWGVRRFGVSFAAAIMAGLMIGSSVFAASRAGGPLYETRLGLEELALPTDAQARVEAELALAQGRLAEIVESAAKDDQRAVAAAVSAYLAALDELDESTGGPADRALLAIQQHREVLESVLGKVPEQARDGIENALVMSSKVIERLDAVATPRPTGVGNASGGSGGGAADNGNGGSNPNAGTGGNNGAGGSNPNAGPGTNNGGGAKPHPTAKPDPTVKPDPTPKPARTPRPERTPAPITTDKPTPKTPQGGKP